MITREQPPASAASATMVPIGPAPMTMAVSPGVWVYQLTDDGLAAELTAKGTKYYKDGDLN